MAPSISNMAAQTIAHRYEMDLDDTLVAHEFATSSKRMSIPSARIEDEDSDTILTCTVVVRIKESKESANGKDISVLVKNGHLGWNALSKNKKINLRSLQSA